MLFRRYDLADERRLAAVVTVANLGNANLDNLAHALAPIGQPFFRLEPVIQHFFHAVFRRFGNVEAEQIPGFPALRFSLASQVL